MSFSSEEFRLYVAEHQCSWQEAKRQLQLRDLQAEINSSTTLEELKDAMLTTLDFLK